MRRTDHDNVHRAARRGRAFGNDAIACDKVTGQPLLTRRALNEALARDTAVWKDIEEWFNPVTGWTTIAFQDESETTVPRGQHVFVRTPLA